MKIVRSPNYPAISLPEAIAKARTVYEKEYNHPSPREVVVKAMGYSGINGASSTVFSAITKYGLIESVGNDQYRISPLALDIFLHNRGDAPRRNAIEKAAFAPPLFAELREFYGKALPSDDNLRAYLIKKDFNPKSVGDVIRAYRDTIELVEDETKGYNPIETKEDKSLMTHQTQTLTTPAQPTLFSNQALEDDDSILVFKLSRTSNVRVIFNGEVTQEAIAKLIILLEASKDTYPTQKELDEPRNDSEFSENN